MIKHYPHHIINVARQLRRRPTVSESKLWERLRNRNLNQLKFVRQYPIGRYVADFYCHEMNLIIELEGSIHNSLDQKKYDERRFEELSGQGFNVLRIRNEDVLNDIESVLQNILEVLPSHPHPRSLSQRERDVTE